MMGWLADCDQETNIQQYALGPTVSKTHLCHTLGYRQLSITFAVFDNDMFVCISFMCFRVHVYLIQPLAARNNKRCFVKHQQQRAHTTYMPVKSSTVVHVKQRCRIKWQVARVTVARGRIAVALLRITLRISTAGKSGRRILLKLSSKVGCCTFLLRCVLLLSTARAENGIW